MSTATRPDDDLYRACITWDVPTIRRYAERDDAMAFLRTVQLMPSAFVSSDETGLREKRPSPLMKATIGLRAELTGDVDAATTAYRAIARLPGLRGLLGLLLLAWTSSAEPSDFAKVEQRLARITGRGSRDLHARCHAKLALWAEDHGWRELAVRHYDAAVAHAGQELLGRLESVGNFYGRDQVLRFGSASGPMTRYDWITDLVSDAARKNLDGQFKQSMRNPRTRTWTIGGGVAEGHEMQSAAFQTSWAGALWLSPQVQRRHAQLILLNSRETADVTRALALFARGGGSDVLSVVNALEGNLSASAVEELLVEQLHEGRSVMRQSIWWELCMGLWHELPSRLVATLVRDLDPSISAPDPSDASAEQLRLFGHLLLLDNKASDKAFALPRPQLGRLLRTIQPGLIRKLDPRIAAEALEAALSEEVPNWTRAGVPAVVRAWDLLPAKPRSELRDRVAAAVPTYQRSSASIVAPSLYGKADLLEALEMAVSQLSDDMANAKRGMYTGYVTQPAIEIARLVLVLGVRQPFATAALIRLATGTHVVADQRQGALTALLSLAQEGLVTEDELGPVLEGPLARLDHVFGEGDGSDEGYESLQTTALRLILRYSPELDAVLLGGSRDSSGRIRALALSTAQWLSLAGNSSGALDATLLGALYDPDAHVQALAVPPLWRGSFEDDAVRSVAKQRVQDLWSTAHIALRLAVAYEVSAGGAAPDLSLERLGDFARADRSALVRWGAESLPVP